MKDILYAEKYTDKNGGEKVRWHNCGILFEKDGKESIKINTLFNFAGAKPNEKGDLWLTVKEHEAKKAESKTEDAQTGAAQSDNPNEDVPF